MTVADLVKSFMESEMSVETVWEKTQAICAQYGINPATLDDANAEFVAKEIDRENAGLAVIEDSGQLVTNEETKGKKRKKATPAPSSDSQQTQTLKPAVIGLRNAIESEVSGLSNAFDREFTRNERKAAQKITQRAKQFAPNVVNYVAEELEGYIADSEVFHGQITGIIQEAFGGFLDN